MEHLSPSEPQAPYRMSSLTEQTPRSDASMTAVWSTPVSIQAFVQRLSLIVELELPCTIYLGNGTPDHYCRGVIRQCTRNNGRLTLRGDDFCLHLQEDRIGSLRLVNRRRSRDCETALEIFGAGGALIARILSTPDRMRAAVWQDIVDTFAFA